MQGPTSIGWNRCFTASAPLPQQRTVVDMSEADVDAAMDEDVEPMDTQAPTDVARAAPSRIERTTIAPDPDIECVVVLRPAQPVPTTALAGALSISISRPVRWLGRRGPGLPWQVLDAAALGPWHEIAACMLIANRAGAATLADTETFLRAVGEVAAASACGLRVARSSDGGRAR